MPAMFPRTTSVLLQDEFKFFGQAVRRAEQLYLQALHSHFNPCKVPQIFFISRARKYNFNYICNHVSNLQNRDAACKMYFAVNKMHVS